MLYYYVILLRQVVENYRRQSVEGLALPFLANWLLGASVRLVVVCFSSSLTTFA
jgi:hypothetical protein